MTLPAEWLSPPREFSVCPWWFWNDRLTEGEIARQIDDFLAHGVYAFTIHPRVGLPRSIGWMSDRMIHCMRFAIREAAAREMWVVLYDEGMYPSGSSSGQVVAENPVFRCRGLACIDLDEAGSSKGENLPPDDAGMPVLGQDENLVAVVRRKVNGHRLAVIDKPSGSYIRGLHYVEDDPARQADRSGPPEDHPPAGDILNPSAVACFIRLVYQRYFDEFGEYFGRTIRAIFTDEPSVLGRGAEPGLVSGTTGIVEDVSERLGYDFTPHLPALWFEDEPDARKHRGDYHWAIQARLEETYYAQIFKWCDEHGIALTGHPAAPDDIGLLRYFHIPGQDLVWRQVDPWKPSALEGRSSTQAKCASSAMIHLGRRRNANELCGAYGPDLTYEEMDWLVNWLFGRGCNLLFPHAFFYSVRGPRIDERPPDVGPNSPWWNRYWAFALKCRRLAWLNTDSEHVCRLAILGWNHHLPWRPAKVCFQNQLDFNYLEARHLWGDAEVNSEGIHLAGMHYGALIVEGTPSEEGRDALVVLEDSGRLLHWEDAIEDREFIERIDSLIPRDVRATPYSPGLRVRHLKRSGADYYLLFNEGQESIAPQLELSAAGKRLVVDPETDLREYLGEEKGIPLEPGAVRVLLVDRS